MKVLYKEINGCKDCLSHKCGMCYELSTPIKDLSFENDCPLPTIEIVESFTRYITREKSIMACGNCRHWHRWGYNKHIKTEIGICKCADNGLLSVACNTKACDNFKEVK